MEQLHCFFFCLLINITSSLFFTENYKTYGEKHQRKGLPIFAESYNYTLKHVYGISVTSTKKSSS